MNRLTSVNLFPYLHIWDNHIISGGAVVKNPCANAGNSGSISGSGRSPGEGNDNLLQYSCLENSMNRGVWQITIHRVPKSQTWLSDWSTTVATPSTAPGTWSIFNRHLRNCYTFVTGVFSGGSDGEESACNACREDPLEKEMTTYSSILARRIPWTEDPGGL